MVVFSESPAVPGVLLWMNRVSSALISRVYSAQSFTNLVSLAGLKFTGRTLSGVPKRLIRERLFPAVQIIYVTVRRRSGRGVSGDYLSRPGS